MQKSLTKVVGPDIFATESAEPLSILRELFELLEDYAPMWYTEEHHNRAASALGELVLQPVS